MPYPRLRRGPRRLIGRRVARGRRLIARDACPARWGIRHRWVFDGFFWHRCAACGAVA